jgi:hypothetical protein
MHYGVTASVAGLVALGVALRPRTMEDIRDIFGSDLARIAFPIAIIVWPVVGLCIVVGIR